MKYEVCYWMDELRGCSSAVVLANLIMHMGFAMSDKITRETSRYLDLDEYRGMAADGHTACGHSNRIL